MSSAVIIAPLPVINLGPRYRVVLEAIDAATGATVAGVVVRNATIYGSSATGLASDLPDFSPAGLFVGLGSEP